MKHTKTFLSLAVIAVACLFGASIGAQHGMALGVFAAAVTFFVIGNLLAPQTANLCVTLTVSEILSDVIDAFKTRVPALNYFSSDFSSEQVQFGQTIIAHLPSLPTAYAHVAASGYSANAQSARSLLTDVPIVINQWTDVPIKIAHDDATQDRSKNYLKTIGNAGYVLGKTVCDFALGKALAANFSEKTVEPTGNWNRDLLNRVRQAMNLKQAGTPRYAVISSAGFTSLDNDPRIASKDYHGQQAEADPFGRLRNVAGFSEVLEYPAFPDNSENLAGFAFDSRAISIATRLPKDSTELARQLNIPVTYKTEMITDPATGLSIFGVGWIDPNTHIIYVTASVMYGAVAGSQAGSTGALTDYAGHRITTAS